MSELTPAASARLASDTSLDAEELQVSRWREMSPADKARLVAEATTSVRKLSLAGIRSRHPGATERERFLRYAVITLGISLARRAYPEIATLGL